MKSTLLTVAATVVVFFAFMWLVSKATNDPPTPGAILTVCVDRSSKRVCRQIQIGETEDGVEDALGLGHRTESSTIGSTTTDRWIYRNSGHDVVLTFRNRFLEIVNQ